MPVLVTGATGYIAGVLIKELLNDGVTVHATVRDPSKKDRLQYLQDVADESPGTIKFFQADLMEQGSFAEGMKECTIVFHTASPFINTVKDPQRDLVDPAVKGTENVLNEATKTPSVQRVVSTSSNAAISTDASEAYDAPGNVLTEEIWNRTAALDYQPYQLSKTLAEQKAWVIAGCQTQWTLVVMNPALVFGPGLKCHEEATSFEIIKSIAGNGSSALVPAYGTGIVDVRDVAHAHVVAAYKADASGRHLLVGHNSDFLELTAALLPKYGADYPIPTRRLSKVLFWLLAPYVTNMSRRQVWNNINIKANFDNSKSKKELEIEYRSLEETIGDMYQQMIDARIVEKTSKGKDSTGEIERLTKLE
jgi:nucleoside-diphosphate-sugar epimerase